MSEQTNPIACTECGDEMRRLGRLGCTNMHCNPGPDTGLCVITYDPPPPLKLQALAREHETLLVAANMAARTVPLAVASGSLRARVLPAAPGLQGFDANTPLSKSDADLFVAQGFAFCLRYVSRSEPKAGDLSAAEAEIILSAGLALMPVQHVAQDGWTPSAQLGKENGAAAVAHVQQVGFPAGVNVWLDLEGVKKDTAKAEVIDHCNAWFQVVSDAGFAPGVYVGANCGLEAEDLYWRLKTTHYWKSGSRVPSIPMRGYQLTQKIISGDKIGRISIDRNVTQNDSFGGAVLWAVR
jgi:hypothetical protein